VFNKTTFFKRPTLIHQFFDAAEDRITETIGTVNLHAKSFRKAKTRRRAGYRAICMDELTDD
jgi:hypothetical protein